jgi:cytosine deaminase
VLLQARDVVEAIRLRATRLHVWKRGRLVASTPPVLPQIFVGETPRSVEFIQPS